MKERTKWYEKATGEKKRESRRVNWCACGRVKSEKGRRRASSGREVVGQVRWGRKGNGRGEEEG